jgi:beta-lactamase class D
MRSYLLPGLGMLFVCQPACTPSTSPTRPVAARAATTTYDDDGLALFAARNVSGSFVLLDLQSGTTIIVGKDDALRSYPPCSTFKIPNSLIGLETGVVPDEHFTLKWDGEKHEESDEWNRDHDLASAMKYSVVWFYQEVARRIGEPRMKTWLHAIRYGNESTEGGIDHFWLGDDHSHHGGMRISALDQVDLLRRLRTGELPVTPAHAALVTRLLPSVRIGDVEVRGKTGLGESSGRTVGWIVGYAERAERTWVYATHVDGSVADVERIIPLRRELTHALLERYGVVRSARVTPP